MSEKIETKETAVVDSKKSSDSVAKMLSELKEQQQKSIDSINALKKEVFYNRVVTTLFFLVALYYIHLQAGRLGDVIGTLIEIFMPS